MHDYKIKALLDLATPFREAGRAFGEAVFAAGIGNRLHDAVAYKAAGIPEDFIFLIDPESNLRVSLTFIYILHTTFTVTFLSSCLLGCGGSLVSRDCGNA